MNLDPKKLLAEFLKEGKQTGRTVQGLIGARCRVPWLFAYLEEKGLKFTEVRAGEALGYQGWLQAKKTKAGNPYSKFTIAAQMVAATGFYEFLKSRGIVAINPFKEIRKVRVDKKLPRHIPKEQLLAQLLDRLGKYRDGKDLREQKTRYRVHVIAELMYATGLRISEVAALQVPDIDFRRSLVIVHQGKGGRSRLAFLNKYAREVLRLYVEKMRPLLFNEWNEKHGASLFGLNWDSFGKIVNREVKRAAKEVGLLPFTSHGFRHALGFHLLRAGCNIRHIQSILGHKLLRNTEIYTKVDKEDLRAVLDKCHPRKWRHNDE